jgi:hypothetical protein
LSYLRSHHPNSLTLRRLLWFRTLRLWRVGEVWRGDRRCSSVYFTKRYTVMTCLHGCHPCFQYRGTCTQIRPCPNVARDNDK